VLETVWWSSGYMREQLAAFLGFVSLFLAILADLTKGFRGVLSEGLKVKERGVFKEI
jgi:hypothetical protein